MRMISGSNTIDKDESTIDFSDKEQQKNENRNSFGFSGTLNTIDLIQAKFDNMVKIFDSQHT